MDTKDSGIPQVRVMQRADIDFAIEMTTIENWGNVPADFERLLDLSPKGCFVAATGGRNVGMITTTCHGKFAFLGSLIVRQELRGRGIGALLMKEAMEYLAREGVKTMELDGVFEALPLYRRCGFCDKYLSLRFRGRARGQKRSARRYRKSDFDSILMLDVRSTGLHREQMLARFLHEFGPSTYVTGEREIEAYAVAREVAAGAMLVGPMVATRPQFANDLLETLFSCHPEAVFSLGVPATNQVMIGLLNRYGFEYAAPSLRMYFEEKINYERYIYAIASPEKG